AAGFVGGTSFVAPGRYIPVEATTEPGDTRVLRTGMSTYGWIRLRLLDKPHTGRSLRITSHGPYNLGVRADAVRDRTIVIAGSNAQVTFYYGLPYEHTNIWNADFSVQLIGHYGQVLEETSLYGHRDPVPQEERP